MTSDKTFDEHLEYVRQMVRLELWFIRHWLAGHPEEGFPHVIRQRTGIYLKSDVYDGGPFKQIAWADPRWLELEGRAQELLTRARGDADSSRFEEEGLAIFLPSLEARARADFAKGVDRTPASQCGSLRYDPPKPETPQRAPFHIGNAVRPRSIFDDPEYLPRCLLCLMNKSEREYRCDSLSTTTWLNSYPRWLAIFPPEWMENLGPEMTAPTAGMGFWGQFVSARGTFNGKHARMLRETGRFPFWPRPSWCAFEMLREHIARRWPGLVGIDQTVERAE